MGMYVCVYTCVCMYVCVQAWMCVWFACVFGMYVYACICVCTFMIGGGGGRGSVHICLCVSDTISFYSKYLLMTYKPTALVAASQKPINHAQ